MRKNFVIVFVLILFVLSSCGTILYPERRGHKGGELDPAVVVLDALGLLFFIIPGVVSFAVDFDTGCIYMGGSKIKKYAYNEKIWLNKSEDMYIQIDQILNSKYHVRLSQALIQKA